MVNPVDDNGSLDRKPAAQALDGTTKKRPPSPRYSQAESGSAINGGSATKPGSVPVTPHQVMLSPKKPKFLSPSNDLSPLSLKGTFSPTLKWPEDHQLALPQLPPSPEVTYIKIPHQHIPFNATTWWLVDLHHEPPMEHGATPLVARCLRQYPTWDEALARRVLKGYRQYLSLTIDAKDWRGRSLLAPPLVDQMWSLHVQDLATYCHDCMLLCGQVLSRNMHNSNQLDQRRADTVRQLEQKFGSCYDTEIWSYGEGVAKTSGDSKPCEAKETTPKNTAPMNSIVVPRIGRNSKPIVAPWPETTRACLTTQNHKPKDTTRGTPYDKCELPGNVRDDHSVALFPELEAQAVENTPKRPSAEGGGEESVSCYQFPSPFPGRAVGHRDEIVGTNANTPTIRGKTRKTLNRSFSKIKRKAEKRRKVASEVKNLNMRIPMIVQKSGSKSSRKAPPRTRAIPRRSNTLRNSSITRIRYSD